MGEGSDDRRGEGSAAVVRAFERVLMRRHRLELRTLALSLDVVVRALETLGEQQEAAQDTSPAVERAVAALQARVPAFWGEQEMEMFVAACRAFAASWVGLQLASDGKPDARSGAHKQGELLSEHVDALDKEARRAAPVTSLLSDKRSHLAGFLDDAALLLEKSLAHRAEEMQARMASLMESYRRALLDPAVAKRKQLEFELSSIETSALTMLLPHLEICRTIVTANAEVRSNASRFSSSECAGISAFVATATCLKDRVVEFSSIATRSVEFVRQLELFERAASKDAFLVCSTALKLQFQESLDKELFLAYLTDWNAKQALLRGTIKNAVYVAAMDTTAALKQQVESLDRRIRESKSSGAVDEPTRAALEQEVARLFEREGSTLGDLAIFHSS